MSLLPVLECRCWLLDPAVNPPLGLQIVAAKSKRGQDEILIGYSKLESVPLGSNVSCYRSDMRIEWPHGGNGSLDNDNNVLFTGH